jgi:nucleotidyltransferase/DNA polymerase involved in DNA repair
MSILYCAIPHFPAALTRRDHPELREHPLILIDPEDRVFAASEEAATCGVVAGIAVHTAQIHCPEAHLMEADLAGCRREFEILLQLLEHTGPKVEPHGWDAAYVDLGDLARDHANAIALCKEIGQSVRRELGDTLQPALGWNSSKFTAQAAARRTRPGRLLAVPTAREREFLTPLPVSLLPLAKDVLRRLGFLGLRTLGQYAALPPAAVWQQFGRAGKQAHRYARGEDDRPIVPRWQTPTLAASYDFEAPLVEQGRLLVSAQRLLGPLLAQLRGNLQACGQVHLAVHFDDGSAQERTRSFLFPTADEPLVTRASEQLLDKIHWPAAATALTIVLEQIQDAVMEQLTLFPAENEREHKLREVQRYLAARFGANRLRRAILAQPNAPIPEWRAGWIDGDEP